MQTTVKTIEQEPSSYPVISLGVTEDDIKTLVAAKADKTLIQGDKKSYLEVKSALMDFVHARNKIEDRKRDIKRDVDGKAKKLLAMLEPGERSLRVQVENEDARIKAIEDETARVEAERKSRIQNRMTTIKLAENISPLATAKEIEDRVSYVRTLKDFDFQEFADDMETMTDDIMGTLTVALANRQEFEKREADQKAKEATQKAENERLAKLAADLKAKQRAMRSAQVDAMKAEYPELNFDTSLEIDYDRTEEDWQMIMDALKEEALKEREIKKQNAIDAEKKATEQTVIKPEPVKQEVPDSVCPTIIYEQDGNQICAHFEDFDCLQTSPAGFGDTKEQAKEDLLSQPVEQVPVKAMTTQEYNTEIDRQNLIDWAKNIKREIMEGDHIEDITMQGIRHNSQLKIMSILEDVITWAEGRQWKTQPEK